MEWFVIKAREGVCLGFGFVLVWPNGVGETHSLVEEEGGRGKREMGIKAKQWQWGREQTNLLNMIAESEITQYNTT